MSLMRSCIARTQTRCSAEQFTSDAATPTQPVIQTYISVLEFSADHVAFAKAAGAVRDIGGVKLAPVLPTLAPDTKVKDIERVLKSIKKRLGAVSTNAIKDYITHCGLSEPSEAMQLSPSILVKSQQRNQPLD